MLKISSFLNSTTLVVLILWHYFYEIMKVVEKIIPGIPNMIYFLKENNTHIAIEKAYVYVRKTLYHALVTLRTRHILVVVSLRTLCKCVNNFLKIKNEKINIY